jgi:ribonuclease P/MRP protein subunit POP5
LLTDTGGAKTAGDLPSAAVEWVVKHLPKHLRPRWRYLAVGLESCPDADIDRQSFQQAVYYASQNLLGDPGSAELDASVLAFRFDDGTGEAVVRVRRKAVDRLRAVLASIPAVDGDPLGVVVCGVSGTVRACEEKYIGGPSEATEESTVAFAGTDRTAVIRGDRVDVEIGGGHVGATALDIREN